LFFELTEVEPKLNKAIEYFAKEVLLPGDNLIAITPAKTYRLKDKGLALKGEEEIAEQLKSLVRRDTLIGNAEYKSAMRDLTSVTKSITGLLPVDLNPADINSGDFNTGLLAAGDLSELIPLYQTCVQKLEVLREVNELRLIDFAKYLNRRAGQKYVFFFYQREFIPQVHPKYLAQASSALQNLDGIDVAQLLTSAMEFNRRHVSVNIERIRRAFADSSTSVHFLFLTKPAKYVPGVYFAERSSDVFTPFFELAKASGGSTESSANPDYLFKKAVSASENYYLLYYTPKNYTGDGKFKNIKVKVKGKGYKVVHRLGYFSN
jgi:hypothetical protein